MASDRAQVTLCCGHVADAVFPHHHDRSQRDRLALALEGLAEAAIAQLERRTAALERDSHAPVDIVACVQDAIRRNQLRVRP